MRYEEIADWFVEKLKTIFRLYHTNIEIMEQVVQMMPGKLKNLKPLVSPFLIYFFYGQQFLFMLKDMMIAWMTCCWPWHRFSKFPIANPIQPS